MKKNSNSEMFFYGSEYIPRIALGKGVYIVDPDNYTIRVGEKISFPDVSELEFEVLDLVLLLGHPHLHVRETDVGHRYIIKFDKSLGWIKFNASLKFERC